MATNKPTEIPKLEELWGQDSIKKPELPPIQVPQFQAWNRLANNAMAIKWTPTPKAKPQGPAQTTMSALPKGTLPGPMPEPKFSGNKGDEYINQFMGKAAESVAATEVGLVNLPGHIVNKLSFGKIKVPELKNPVVPPKPSGLPGEGAVRAAGSLYGAGLSLVPTAGVFHKALTGAISTLPKQIQGLVSMGAKGKFTYDIMKNALSNSKEFMDAYQAGDTTRMYDAAALVVQDTAFAAMISKGWKEDANRFKSIWDKQRLEKSPEYQESRFQEARIKYAETGEWPEGYPKPTEGDVRVAVKPKVKQLGPGEKVAVESTQVDQTLPEPYEPWDYKKEPITPIPPKGGYVNYNPLTGMETNPGGALLWHQAMNPMKEPPPIGALPHEIEKMPDVVQYIGIGNDAEGNISHYVYHDSQTKTTFDVKPGESLQEAITKEVNDFLDKPKAAVLPPPPEQITKNATLNAGKVPDLSQMSLNDLYSNVGLKTAELPDWAKTSVNDPSSLLFKPPSGTPKIYGEFTAAAHKPIDPDDFNADQHGIVWYNGSQGKWQQWQGLSSQDSADSIYTELHQQGIPAAIVPKEEISNNGAWIGSPSNPGTDLEWSWIHQSDNTYYVEAVDENGTKVLMDSGVKKENLIKLPPHVSQAILSDTWGEGHVPASKTQESLPHEPIVDPSEYNYKDHTIVYRPKGSDDSFYDYQPSKWDTYQDIESYLSKNDYEFFAVPKSDIKANGKWNPPKDFDQPTSQEHTTLSFTEGASVPTQLNNVSFFPVPEEFLWDGLSGFVEGEPPLPPLEMGMEQSAGSIIMEPDGRIWLLEPANHYGGYEHTFPKGRLENALGTVDTAIKEAWEETGLKVQPKEFFGDFKGDTTSTRLFIAERVGGSPNVFGPETQSVKLVTLEQAEKLLNKPRDKEIIKQLMSKYGKPKQPAAPTTKVDLDSLPLDASKMNKITGALGSNPGGWYEATSGERYYIKEPQTAEHALNEVLGAKLYGLAGIDVPEVTLAKTADGKLGVASKEVVGATKGKSFELANAPGVKEGFAVDAWLGNWDVVGMGFDNLMLTPEGKAIRVDTGGSLRYRAMGSEKGGAFGNDVTEIATLRSAYVNPEAEMVFGQMTDKDIVNSIDRLRNISNADIQSLVDQYGPEAKGGYGKKGLATKLINRRDSLLSQGVMLQANVNYEGVFATKPNTVELKQLTPMDITKESNLRIMSETPTFDASEPMRPVVQNYKANGYKEINSLVRGLLDPRFVSAMVMDRAKAMRLMFDKLRPTTWSGTLFRGVNLDIVKNLKVDEYYHDKGFASWSTNAATAHNWDTSKAVLKIEITGKNKIFNVGKALDQYDTEYENLLYNARMRVIRVEMVPRIRYDGTPSTSANDMIREVWGVLEVEE